MELTDALRRRLSEFVYEKASCLLHDKANYKEPHYFLDSAWIAGKDEKEGKIFSLSCECLLRAAASKQIIFVFLKRCKDAHICFDGSVP